MNGKDLVAWPGLTSSCSEAGVVSRVNLFGYAGSSANRRAYLSNNSETLLCPCPAHEKNLEEPNQTTYSSDPRAVEISEREVLLPGAGCSPLGSEDKEIN